jgi:hypothetical protein
MRRMGIAIAAGAGALKMLVCARAKRIELSPNGHEVLEGWAYSPDEKIIALAEAKVQSRLGAGNSALYCFEGKHKGELFLLKASSERLGCDVGASLILTPSNDAAGGSFRMLTKGKLTLTSETAVPFLLNGREEHRSELFDYDEVEMLGNRFVVMAFPTVSKRKELSGKPQSVERTKTRSQR